MKTKIQVKIQRDGKAIYYPMKATWFIFWSYFYDYVRTTYDGEHVRVSFLTSKECKKYIDDVLSTLDNVSRRNTAKDIMEIEEFPYP